MTDYFCSKETEISVCPLTFPHLPWPEKPLPIKQTKQSTAGIAGTRRSQGPSSVSSYQKQPSWRSNAEMVKEGLNSTLLVPCSQKETVVQGRPQ